MKITPEDYERWFRRRFGVSNPERIHNPLHEWMVRSETDPFHLREQIGVQHTFHGTAQDGTRITPEPCWCFVRFGMTRTRMPDGRIICIAGEHEDSYDPDFCIFNDVIVLRPGPGEPTVTETTGEVEIYGYPKDVFPPTDFHSATLVGDRIIVIGRLGYTNSRDAATTPVFSLNTQTYEISPVRTSGASPGFIYNHHASYDSNLHAITVRAGVRVATLSEHPPNFAVHRLHLADNRWELIAEREQHRSIRFEPISENTEDGPGEWLLPVRVPYTLLDSQGYGALEPDLRMDIMGVRVVCDDPTLWRFGVRIEGELPKDVIATLVEDILSNCRRGSGIEWRAIEVPE